MKYIKVIINITGLIMKYSVIAVAVAKAVEVFHNEIKQLSPDEKPEADGN